MFTFSSFPENLAPRSLRVDVDGRKPDEEVPTIQTYCLLESIRTLHLEEIGGGDKKPEGYPIAFTSPKSRIDQLRLLRLNGGVMNLLDMIVPLLEALKRFTIRLYLFESGEAYDKLLRVLQPLAHSLEKIVIFFDGLEGFEPSSIPWADFHSVAIPEFRNS